MTKKKKVKVEDDVSALEGTLKAMNLKSEPASRVNSKPTPGSMSNANKPFKMPIVKPMYLPESKVKPRQDIAAVFNEHFGVVSKLENWQRLCWDLNVDDEDLSSLRKCKKALSKVNINIFDVVEAQMAREEARVGAEYNRGGVKIKLEDGGEFCRLNVRKFHTRVQLLRYTRRHKKFYPRDAAKELGPIRYLLKVMK